MAEVKAFASSLGLAAGDGNGFNDSDFRPEVARQKFSEKGASKSDRVSMRMGLAVRMPSPMARSGAARTARQSRQGSVARGATCAAAASAAATGREGGGSTEESRMEGARGTAAG